MHRLLLLLLFIAPQEDLAPWIEKLGDESIEVREKATRHLQALKESDVERLQKAMESHANAEVRARLAAIILHIKKSAELGKVLSPTRRITLSGKGLKVGDVIKQLADQVGPTLAFKSDDGGKTVDLDLANVTWWDALDRTLEAAGLEGEFGSGPGKKVTLRWKSKSGPPMPVVYLEQFRIQIVDTRRFETREPGTKSESVFVTLAIYHQPDLKPSRVGLNDAVRILSVTDAKRVDVLGSAPEGQNGMSWHSSMSLAHYTYAWVNPDAASPLTITGTTALPFPKDTQDIQIPLESSVGSVVKGRTTFEIKDFTQSKARTALKLKVRCEDTKELFELLIDESLYVEDAEGARHKGRSRGSGQYEETTEWEFEFNKPIKDPKKVGFRWIAETHPVELPFRLEGVKLP